MKRTSPVQPTFSMSDLDRWFQTSILVHEEALMRFLARAWANHSELDDIRQEIYVAVYQAATKTPPRLPKSYLFKTARHLLIDRIRRRRVVSIEAIGGWSELDDLSAVIDEPSCERNVSARQELHRLAVAFDDLPQRCREVLWLRRVEDMPQRDVARKLNVSEGAVEKALARAVYLLTHRILGGKREEQAGAPPAAKRTSKNDKRHRR